ncbi:MAG: GNAT family N-acetyltransferase [Actinomyces graevenitzii]|jgi:acetyltransferase|uniref:GNAT family N-acetyltransferase n=1 Tax=Actinomyces graevenitzii TaxID=55565 RepID=A0A9E7AFR2_9ACTO|nr:GNAT family N-acetyltransferase [Actinomyces graevenitzii]MBS4941944.1 GNAT family N-acetyltransferase [Actinomyces graevenitzii]MBS5244368.1 GNAT family N-acetyltransferase [Actinomyces graevenitzii]UQF79615.1 MAG: GNAT family N-acetyltransferase [Actinomyces graevenitzii]
MSVELIEQSSPELVAAMERLIPQLSRSAKPLTAEQTQALVDQDSVYLFVFRTDKPVIAADGNEVEAGTILGMLSLATFAIPTGVRAWVEDVVVDAGTRGMGAGQQLVEAAVAHAQKIGARTVDLTSRPSREAANRLYRRCGFELRETNVYRYASN